MIGQFLEKLQKKSYETRMRILWGSTALAAILLLIIWLISIRSTVGGNNDNPSPNNTVQSQPVSSQFVNIERVEQTGSALKIYFNLDNTTDDILNVSAASDISLDISSGTINPTAVQDRQGQPFVRKVLSHTQVFGILVFTPTSDENAKLIFNQMFLEDKPSEVLKQELTLNFKELNQSSNVRH